MERAEDVFVVGIGASAGGLEALTELVRAIPTPSGFAYVVVQHLSPDHDSKMDRLLAAHSSIPVVGIAEGQVVEPDRIYVLPAAAWATIEGRTLRLHARLREAGPRTPIDRFLVSLAESQGRMAFCVILSGTGSDGTLGVRAIKEAGGFAIAQQSDSARFPGMPDSAVATGLVDCTLTPRQIPDRLIDIARHRDALRNGSGEEELREQIESELPAILRMLDDAEGHDFSTYKSGTLVRRIERRMTVLRETRVASLVDRLTRDPEERVRLVQDFLIGVTRFFRDETAFAALLEHAVLPLLGRDQKLFRIWVPGCATGEEAYSIAMLMTEAMQARGDTRQWQVFGTDIDGAALRHARAGAFTEAQVAELSPERRAAYFVRSADTYRALPQLRERCIFAPHNVLSDPPFSRLDLISCRNLLIYLTAEVQESLVTRFHYGLNPGGYLFLGPSETLGKKDRLFFTIDREARLFRREDDVPAEVSSLGSGRRDALRRERRLEPQIMGARPLRLGAEQTFESQLLTFYARQAGPPFAAVNASDEIVYLSEPMGRYVRPPQGQPSAAIEQFLVRELRLPVRTALSELRETGQTVRTSNLMVTVQGEMQVVDLTVQALPFSDGDALVTLQPVRLQDAAALSGSADARDDAERELIERELAMTRRQLAATLSSYEMTEQELKSSNEELLSMNEELQSSNEELEASREELQSINEELETVNAELTENNLQLLAANSDLKNLHDSTDIATVFLDQLLCVRRFTPALRRLFGVQERDIGRPITDLKGKVSYDALEADARQVAETLQPVEREVGVPETGETYLVRVRPYRRTDDRIDGCVLTFVDITARKATERRLADNADQLGRQYAELETIYNTTPVGLCLVDRDLRYVRMNARLAELNGKSIEEHIGRTVHEVLPEISETLEPIFRAVLETGEPMLGNEIEGETAAAPGVTRTWIADYFPVFDESGTAIEVSACITEVTEQKRLQRELEAAARDLATSRERLALFVENAPAAIAMFDTDMRYIAASRRYVTDYGIEGHVPLEGRDHYEVATDIPEDWKEAHRRVLAGETLGETEQAYPREDGRVQWVNWRMTPWRTSDGQIGGAILFTEVKTAEVEARAAARESEAKLRRLFDQAPTMICMHEGPEHRYIYSNPAHQTATGDRDLVGQSILEAFPELADQGVIARYDLVFTTGKGHKIDEFAARLELPGGRTERWYSQYLEPWYGPGGQIGGVLSFAFDVTAEREARRAMEESEARLQFALETSGIGAWEVELATGAVERTSQLDRIFGNDEPPAEWTAESTTEYVLEDYRAPVRAAYDASVANGEKLELRYPIRRADGDIRWIEVHGRPIQDETGKPVRFAGTIRDITAQKEAEAQQTLLLQELQHRVKNTMAMTLAIVQFSAGRAPNVESFARNLHERLEAVARTHDLLTANEWRGARLREIVTREMRPYISDASERLRFEGADPLLSSKQMLSLTLAFHELITNAVKHGALSVPEGAVRVSARNATDGMIELTWTEQGGPPVTRPEDTETGFGTLLLDRVSGPDLKGQAKTEFNPDGVKWTIRFPNDRLTAERKPDDAHSA